MSLVALWQLVTAENDPLDSKFSRFADDLLAREIIGSEEILGSMPREAEILLPYANLLIGRPANPLSQVI